MEIQINLNLEHIEQENLIKILIEDLLKDCEPAVSFSSETRLNGPVLMTVTQSKLPIKGKYLLRIDISEPPKLIGTLLNNPIRETFIEQKVEGIQNGAKNQITKGTMFYIDCSPVKKNLLPSDFTIECDGIWSMTNKNPNLLPTLTITKIYN